MYKIRRKPFTELKRKNVQIVFMKRMENVQNTDFQFQNLAIIDTHFCEYYVHIKDYLDKNVKGYA